MFTGLIEEMGTIKTIEHSEENQNQSAVMVIKANEVLKNCKLGDSIAIDGCCTTVVSFNDSEFTIEASPETLDKTTFKTFKPERLVNLERPLTPSTRLGGHFVTGHVDGKALVISKEETGNSWVFYFRLLDENLVPLFIEKGSVTVNGISLTVNEVTRNGFSVAIIPHTWEKTNIHCLELDDLVNIEADILGKYVQRLLPSMGLTAVNNNADNANPKIPAMPTEKFGNSTIHSGGWFNLG